MNDRHFVREVMEWMNGSKFDGCGMGVVHKTTPGKIEVEFAPNKDKPMEPQIEYWKEFCARLKEVTIEAGWKLKIKDHSCD